MAVEQEKDSVFEPFLWWRDGNSFIFFYASKNYLYFALAWFSLFNKLTVLFKEMDHEK